MNSGGEDGPGRAQEGTTNGSNGNISTESAVAALEQHDTLFHRQVMHLRQQQVELHQWPKVQVLNVLSELGRLQIDKKLKSLLKYAQPRS